MLTLDSANGIRQMHGAKQGPPQLGGPYRPNRRIHYPLSNESHDMPDQYDGHRPVLK